MASALLTDALQEALPELFVEKQVLAAEQAFERRLAEYDMNIEQEKLFREDLRDLTELTVGRMDIYHLVGALLLEFCITFYAENTMFELGVRENMPDIVTYFCLCNLSAAGFLILAVWLAMHASVVAQSTGTRLLTRFARLSVPSRQELEDVAQAPLLPIFERLKLLAKRVGLNKDARGLLPPMARGMEEPSSSDESPAMGEGNTAASNEASAMALQEGERVQDDPERHLRRFLNEQRRWLCYDAYSRICMSMGMNQMLLALCYYLIGKIEREWPEAALLSVCGLQWLSFLLLQLDIAPGKYRRTESFMLFLLGPFAPLYAAFAHYLHEDTAAMGLALLPVYILHGSWLLLVVGILHRKPSDNLESLPRRLRTSQYLDVLHLDPQQTEALEVETMELQQRRKDLQKAMLETMAQEASAGQVSVTGRNSDRLLHLGDALKKKLKENQEASKNGILGVPAQQIDKQRAQRRLARKALEHFAVWRHAPEICAELEALRRREVKEWLTESQRQAVEKAYGSFLQRCQELDLGMGDGLPNIAEGVGLPVHVEMPPEFSQGYTPSEVWLDPESSNIRHEAPSGRSASFERTLNQDLPAWNAEAIQLASSPVAASDVSPSAAFATPAAAESAPHAGWEQMSIISERPEDNALPWILPSKSMTPQQLPGAFTRRYAGGLCCLWLAAAIISVVKHSKTAPRSPVQLSEPVLATRFIAAAWPEPATFFDVESLHCNGSTVFVGSPFASFSAQRLHDGLSALSEFHDVFESVFCQTESCYALSRPLEEDGSRRFAVLESQRVDAFQVPTPKSWRNVAACWIPCQNKSSCEAVRLAGWDGSRIVIAELTRLLGEAWSFHPRFSLLFRSEGLSRGKYSDVQSLQFSAQGASLTVLHEGRLLDAWDLEAGKFLGRWQFKASFKAMCQSGQEILLSRQGEFGSPELALASVPAILAGRGCDRASEQEGTVFA